MGGLTPLAIPFTGYGKGQENFDTTQLLAVEERGDELSESEKKALNSQTISLPRTMYYASKMLQAWATIMKAGGDETVIYLAAKEMADWTNKNEQVLSKFTQKFDKNIPTKLVYQVGAGFNNYFNAAKYEVPPQHWINFSDTQKEFLNNKDTTRLPAKIKQLLDPKMNKKRDELGSPTNEDRERKRPFEMHNHDN